MVVKNEKSEAHEPSEKLVSNANRLKNRVVAVMEVVWFPGGRYHSSANEF